MPALTTTSALRHALTVIRQEWAHDLTDGELLQKFATDADPSAFAELVRRHSALALGVCRRVLRDHHDAEDALQAAFLVLARKASTIQGASVGAWLYRVAYRIALDARARAARRHQHEQRGVDVPGYEGLEEAAAMRFGSTQEPSMEVARRELCRVIDEELNRLPPKYSAPLILCYLQHRSHQETARELGCPSGTISRRVGRASELLRERLAQRGIALSTALLATLLTDLQATACVSPVFAQSIVRSAVLCTIQTAVAGAITAPVAALVEGCLHTMNASRHRIVTALVIATGCVAMSIGTLLHHALAQAPAKFDPAQAVAVAPDVRAVAADAEALPEGALARFGTPNLKLQMVNLRHLVDPGRVSFSADLRTLAWTNGRRVQFVDVDSGKETRHWERPAASEGFSGLSMTPDGKHLLTSEKAGGIRLRDTATGKELGRFKAPAGSFVFGFALAPDGKTFAVGHTDANWRLLEVAIRDLPSGKEKITLKVEKPEGVLGYLGFANATTLVSWTRGPGYSPTNGFDASYPICLWDVATGKKIREVECKKGLLHAACAPDGQTLYWTEMEPQAATDRLAAGHGPGATHVVSIGTGKETAVLRGLSGPAASGLAVSDRFIATQAAEEGKLKLWDRATGKEHRALECTTKGCIVTFSKSGDRLAVVGQGDLRIYDVATGKQLLHHSHGGHLDGVADVAISPDGKTLASTGYQETFFWDVPTRKVLHHAETSYGLNGGLYPPAAKVLFRPDGKTAVVVKFNTIRIVDVKTGKELSQFESRVGLLRDVALSPDGKLLAMANSGLEQSIQLLDLATGKVHREFSGMLANCIAFSPDGRTLAAGIGIPPDAAVNQRVIPGTWCNRIRLWNLPAGEESANFGDTKIESNISQLAFAPNGRTLATVYPMVHPKTRLWEVATRQPRVDIPGSIAAWSRDSRWLAVTTPWGEPRQIDVWDVAQAKAVRQFQGSAACVAFAPDGNSLVSASGDTTIIQWDIRGLRKQRPQPAALTNDRLTELWADLASKDSARAYAALTALASAPDAAVSFLKGRLKPAAKADPRIVQLVADLDDASFEVRTKAAAELEKLGEQAEPALQQRLARPIASLELRRRIERLLAKLNGPDIPTGRLQILRALEALELADTPATRTLLESLAKGEEGAWLTRAARAALHGRP
jgi:RNA polymerase sigma factor (sigma-70 family)